MPIIEVKNLSKTYTSFKKAPGLWNSVKSLVHRQKIQAEAVRNINFSIAKGELVGFLGPNGAGKTTTLKMLSGILYPTDGQAKVLGHVPWQRKADYQKQFALVMGQKNQLWWDLPAMESYVLNKEIYEIPDKKFKQTLEELTGLLEIEDILEIPVRKLSLGQRMKAELTAALLHAPKVLFLDEPTIGLDVVSQQNIRDFISKYNKDSQTTIILTSHYMEDIEKLCERVVIIDHGEIVYDDKLDRLRKKYIDYKILQLTIGEKVDLDKLKNFGNIKKQQGKKVVLEVPKERVNKVAATILTTLPIEDIVIAEEEIDEVIRKIFSEPKVLNTST